MTLFILNADLWSADRSHECSVVTHPAFASESARQALVARDAAAATAPMPLHAYRPAPPPGMPSGVVGGYAAGSPPESPSAMAGPSSMHRRPSQHYSSSSSSSPYSPSFPPQPPQLQHRGSLPRPQVAYSSAPSPPPPPEMILPTNRRPTPAEAHHYYHQPLDYYYPEDEDPAPPPPPVREEAPSYSTPPYDARRPGGGNPSGPSASQTLSMTR